MGAKARGKGRDTHESRGLRAWTEMERTALAANPGVIEARIPERAPRLATVATAATCPRRGGGGRGVCGR